MDLEILVDNYVSAWNRRNVEDLLNILHGGFAIYNAFWMESSVGKDAATYLRDILEEERYWYQRTGASIPFDNGVVYRYTAHELNDSTPGNCLFSGAEVLNIRNGRILSISDFYCDPSEKALIEVAKLTSARHGQSKYVKSGIRAVK